MSSPEPQVQEVPDQSAVAAPNESENPPRPVVTQRSSSRRFVSQDDDVPIKIIGPNNEEILPDEIVQAPDGGWGWVVVFSAFMSNLVVDGTIYSFGVILNSMVLAEKDHGRKLSVAQVAWVGSIQAGFYLASGPFVSSVANMFGFRITAIAGSITAFTGFMLAYFFNMEALKEGPNLTMLFLFFGFVAGVGMSLLYVPSLITVGFYFEKKRALATGIAVCGSGVGTFLYAPIVNGIVGDENNWPLAILIEGCLLLSLIFFVAMYRPLKAPKRPAGQVALETTTIMGPPADNLSVRLKAKQGDTDLDTLVSVNSLVSSAGVSNEGAYQEGGMVNRGRESAPNMSAGRNDTSTQQSNELTGSIRNAKSKPKITLVVDAAEAEMAESRIFRVASKKTLNKPLHRSHIFYPANLDNIKNRTDKDENYPHLEWEAQTVKNEALPPPKKSRWYTFPILRKMLDFSLLKSMTFILLSLSGGVTFLGLFVPFIYLIGIASEHGMYYLMAPNLIAVIGIANTLGRVICGFVADKIITKVLLINNVALTVGGIATILVPLIEGNQTEIFFFAYALVFGLSCACFISLRSILAVELVGLPRLTNAMGIILLFQGLATFFGSPLAGILKDQHGYAASFYFAGSLLLFSGVMCFPLHLMSAWEKKKEEKKVVRIAV